MIRVFNSIYTDEEDDPLQKQFKTLEIEWDSIKQSISGSDHRKPTTAGDHRLFQLQVNSPKELMSLLQLQSGNSPSKELSPNPEHHDRAAIDDFGNGGIRGRRLFDESDVGSDDNGGIHGGCFDVDEQSEVSTEFSCSGVGYYDDNYNRCCSYGCGDPWRSDEAESGVTVAVKGGRGGFVRRLMIFVVVMLELAIVVFKCSCEDEDILVPT